MKDIKELRKGDFWTSLVLLAIAVAMILGATTFPMTDSYGGVQNVWYVSPALFPLIVGAGIVILSLVLLAKAITSGGARTAITALRGATGRLAERDVRLIVIIVLIAAYVYALVPRVDFFVGTVLFLQTFILSYYPDRSDLMKINAGGFVGFAVVTGVLAAAGLPFVQGSALSAAVDIAGLLLIAALALASWLRAGSGDAALRGRVRTGLLTGLLVPLILCPTFKYFLLVPLPAEGVVIRTMDAIRYGLRGLTG